jgi:peptidoglycan-associated lipoprotein
MSRRLVIAAALLLVAVGCGNKKLSYPSCGSDKDCHAGEHCVNKQCRQCATDDQCKAGESCVNGACLLQNGACRNDGDCQGGQVCKDHKCSNCADDRECGPDKRCSSGHCLARGACNKDEDCADDEDCVKGTCQKQGGKAPDVACQLEPVYFGFDQAAIEDSSKATLNKAAECMQQAAGHSVLLIGHTDPRGTEEYNVALSERRGQTVADYLARLGIDPARMRVEPKGETEASGTDEGSWAKDRRVDLQWQ